MSVIQFRFDDMTARQRLAIERRLASLSAAREPNRCPLRHRELARGQTEIGSGWLEQPPPTA